MNPAQPPCPCGTGQAYTACCGCFHAGPLHLQAPTAEALMRSRYSAYVLGLGDYLQDTWHASTRPSETQTFDPEVRWLGLQVRHHQALTEDSAVVEFVARSKRGGRAQRLHESSRFLREHGRWFYLDGDLKPLPADAGAKPPVPGPAASTRR